MTDDHPSAPNAAGVDAAAAAAAPPRDGAAAPVASSYDAVPYSVGAFPQTRPDRLATVATLFGMRAAHPSRCRVLELGCAAGGNILPMALADPDSHFVGIDLSPRQIDDAQSTARELGLHNADLRCLSILDIDDAFGTFDYILCHGVYSWVPPQVQEKILRVCSANLAPDGVAYVSYNTYPGWHARGAIREMLWYHTERFTDPAERIRQARGLLAFLALTAERGGGGGAFSTLLRQELAVLQATPDTYLLHEHLEEFNEPLYFHQFAGRAARSGLQYLGEAQMSSMVPGRFGAEAEKLLRGISPDLLHMEQYMDFLRNRMFRQTLLCHDTVTLDFTLRPESVMTLRVASSAKAVSPQLDLRPDHPEEFRSPAGPSLKTHDPFMKAAMDHLAARWPLPIPFPDLLAAAGAALPGQPAPSADEARQLALRLLNCYTSNLLEFSISPPGFVIDVSERPIASPYARLRARHGTKVNNLRLEAIALTEPSRLVLQHLDGHHDRNALVRLIEDWLSTSGSHATDPLIPPAAATTPPDAHVDPPKTPAHRAAAYIDALLHAFARSALLIA